MSNPDAAKHPVSFFFHFAFKVAVFFWYVFCTWFSDSFVTNFVVAVILLALDFWTVKNVTGRFLVGLRFWNEVSQEGGSAWRFETLREGDRSVNSAEKWWFWVILVVNPCIWAFFGIVALLRAKLEYLIIPVMGVILGSSNMIGYFKCSKEAKGQLQNMSTSLMQSAFTSSMNAAISRV